MPPVAPSNYAMVPERNAQLSHEKLFGNPANSPTRVVPIASAVGSVISIDKSLVPSATPTMPQTITGTLTTTMLGSYPVYFIQRNSANLKYAIHSRVTHVDLANVKSGGYRRKTRSSKKHNRSSKKHNRSSKKHNRSSKKHNRKTRKF